MGNPFTTYASHLLSQSTATTSAPLFYSTRDVFTPAIDPEDDILGASASLEDLEQQRSSRRGRGRQLSFGSMDDGRGSYEEEEEEEAQQPSASLMGGVPAFMSRLSSAPARFSRGWRAHESVAQHHHHYLEHEEEESGSDFSDEEEEDSPPGAFLSTPLHPQPPARGSTTEPLLAPRTLFVYPMQGQAVGGGVRAQGQYRDSHWIVIYGLSLIAVFILGLVEWWKSPKIPPPATPLLDSSIFTTLPILALLSFISLLAGFSSFSYLLAVHHSMRHFIHAALLGGPLVLVGCGVVAFAGSFSASGVASDGGWKRGVRTFAAGCFLLAYMLARQAVKRRKQVARAIAIGELATQTILAHPPLILLCLVLSVLSTVIALPFLLLLAGLLFDGVTSSGSLAGRESFFTLLVYTWTLAILRGVQHAVVGGVVGTYYFERESDSYPGAVQVVRAALRRATHQSLGTIIFASAFTSLFTTLTTLLTTLKRRLRSKHLHPLLHPLTYLVPLFSIITSAIAAFNSYALGYAGMTGEEYLTSGREVVKMLRANETGSLGDSLLIRLVLLVTSLSWGLLAGLIAFLLASSRLKTGALAPVVAVLCFFVPMWTMKLCQDVCGDAVDSLFICMNLDLARDTPSEGELQRKAAEAFGMEEEDSFA